MPAAGSVRTPGRTAKLHIGAPRGWKSTRHRPGGAGLACLPGVSVRSLSRLAVSMVQCTMLVPAADLADAGSENFDLRHCFRARSCRAARQRALFFAARVRLFCAFAWVSNWLHSSGGLPLLSIRRNVRWASERLSYARLVSSSLTHA
jgi:hypothetical protein